MKISTDYLAGLYESVKANSGSIPDQRGYEDHEWGARSIRCARRLLSAVMFREMAQLTLDKIGSQLLPNIGFYYGMYHLGAACLYLDYQTTLDELRNLKHNSLESMLSERLVRRKLLEPEFVRSLSRLRKIREYTNYTVGGGLWEDELIDNDEFKKLYDATANSFSQGCKLIRALAGHVEAQCSSDPFPPGISRIRYTIGDHWGDDAISIHIPMDGRSRVWDYLIEADLTN
jgi:hypothetical protein